MTKAHVLIISMRRSDVRFFQFFFGAKFRYLNSVRVSIQSLCLGLITNRSCDLGGASDRTSWGLPLRSTGAATSMTFSNWAAVLASKVSWNNFLARSYGSGACSAPPRSLSAKTNIHLNHFESSGMILTDLDLSRFIRATYPAELIFVVIFFTKNLKTHLFISYGLSQLICAYLCGKMFYISMDKYEGFDRIV